MRNFNGDDQAEHLCALLSEFDALFTAKAKEFPIADAVDPVESLYLQIECSYLARGMDAAAVDETLDDLRKALTGLSKDEERSALERTLDVLKATEIKPEREEEKQMDPLKVLAVRVQGYRSIVDSGWVDVGPHATSLLGDLTVPEIGDFMDALAQFRMSDDADSRLEPADRDSQSVPVVVISAKLMLSDAQREHVEAAGGGWHLTSNIVYVSKNNQNEWFAILAGAEFDPGADPTELPGQAKAMNKLDLRLRDPWNYHGAEYDQLWSDIRKRVGPRYHSLSRRPLELVPDFFPFDYRLADGELSGSFRTLPPDAEHDRTFRVIAVRPTAARGDDPIAEFRRFLHDHIEPAGQLVYAYPRGFLSHPERKELSTPISSDCIASAIDARQEHAGDA